MGFGGAGPLHANALGILTNAWPTIVPPGPGVLCAYGDATTEVRDESSRSFVSLLKDIQPQEFEDILAELKQRATETLTKDGIAVDNQHVVYQADVRYTGQAFQLSVEFDQQQLESEGLSLLKARFDEEHTQLFTFALDEGHEIVMLRAIATAKGKALPDPVVGVKGSILEQCEIAKSDIYYEGQYHQATIYDRSKLHEDLQVAGPAIVSEMDSTTVILPGYVATVDTIGNLLINPITQS